MTDEERRLTAAAKALAIRANELVGQVSVASWNSEALAKAAIDAYNTPLERVVPELIEQMAKAIDNADGRGDFRLYEARAALQMVVRRLSTPLPPVAIANYLGLSEQYVRELIADE